MAYLGSEPSVMSEGEFALDSAGEGLYSREISRDWTNNGSVVFGGYSAALSFAAAVQQSPFPALCSGHVAFLKAVQPGRIEFKVTVPRLGRSVAAVRVDALQNGRLVLISQAWLRPAPTTVASSGAVHPGSSPADAVELPWLARYYGFHRWIETRGVDYPSGVETFALDGKRHVDLWSRPNCGELPPGIATQLYDILVADAHLMDGQMRGAANDPDSVVSLDLAIQWTPFLHRPGWRRIQALASPAADNFAACNATILDEAGAICATAAQQTFTIASAA